MATIQIRDVPEDVAETFRRRAKAAGQSLQPYLREHLIKEAGRPDKREIMAILEQTLASHPTPGVSRESIREARRELEERAERYARGDHRRD
jgi:plasmid stability protein